jgi:hypothetical protein
MYYLYPRLPIPIAEKIATERSSLSITDLVAVSDIQYSGATTAPVGGHKADSVDIKNLQKEIRTCAKKSGYPHIQKNDENLRAFDYECSIMLYEKMNLHPSEASHIEMWAFISCVLVPDVVRWRFSGEKTSLDRFIGSDRGLRRNTFGRLWWRAYLFVDLLSQNPYILLKEMGEDDLVQVTERNSITSNKTFLVSFCKAYIKALQNHQVSSRLLIRETSKRLRRLFSFLAFDALDHTQVSVIVDDLFNNTAATLKLSEEI